MKTTVQVEGKSVEVDIPGVVPEADVAAKYMPKDVVEQIVKDRLAQFAKGHIKVDDLDDAGKKALAERLGWKLEEVDADGEPKIGKQLEQAKGEWTERELKPLQEQVKTHRGEVETLRSGKLADSIVAVAAKAGVKTPLLTPLVAGEDPPIVAMLQRAFGFDEKSKRWFVKSADGFAFSADPAKNGPYKSVDEFVTDWAKLPANKDFIGVTTQGGPGIGTGGGAGGGGAEVIVLTREQAENHALWNETLKKVGGDPTRIKVADEQ